MTWFSVISPHQSAAGLHSPRRLGATTAYLRGLPVDLIMVAGGWTSLTFQRYLKLTEDDRIDLSRFAVDAEDHPLTVGSDGSHNRQLHLLYATSLSSGVARY